MAMSKTSPRLRLRCQWCNTVNYTKNLKMECICKNCKKWAKYRNQKIVKIPVYHSPSKKIIDVWQVVKQSKPCTACGSLTPTDKACRDCNEMKVAIKN